MSKPLAARVGGGRGTVWIGTVLLFVGMLAVPFGGLYLYGWASAPEYQVTVAGTMPVAPAELHRTLSDPDKQGDWRPGVTQVQHADPIEGDPVVVITRGSTELALRRNESLAPSKVVWTVVPSKKHVFQGEWVYALAPDGEGGTRITVTETGFIDDPFSRAVTEILIGYEGFSQGTLSALGRFHDVPVKIDGVNELRGDVD